MLLRIFKTSQPLAWILIVLLTIILRGVLFIQFYNLTYASGNTHISSGFIYQFAHFSPWASHILSTILILLTGLFYNKMIQDANILKGIHYLLFLFYSIFTCYSPENLVLSPALLATALSLFSINLIFVSSKGIMSLPTLFNATLITGLATLIFYPSVILFGVLVFALFYFYSATWRHIIIAILGLFTPLFFFDIITFSLTGIEPTTFSAILDAFGSFQFISFVPYLAIGLLLAVIIFQAVFYFNAAARAINKIRKPLNLMGLYWILGILILPFCTDSIPLVSLIIIPLSILFTVFHAEVKKWWVSDLLFISLLLSMAFNYMG